MVKAQQEVQFADVTPERLSSVGSVAVTVRIAGAEADIHNGADAAADRHHSRSARGWRGTRSNRRCGSW